MGGEWRDVQLDQVCDISRGASPRPIHEWVAETGIPWVKISDASSAGSRFIERTRECIQPEGRSKSVSVYPGDLILSNSATPGIPMFMGIEACIHDGWLLLRNFRGLDKLFAYYLLLHDRPALVEQGSGSVFTNLKTEILKKHRVRLPMLADQQAIACILGTLDDKIELNRQMNRTLEEMARAIFKSWFVDFDPVRAKAAVRRKHPNWTNEQISRAACPKLKPEIAALFPDSFEDSELGEIPKGWKVGKFGNCCDVKGGYAYKSKDFADEGYPLVRIKNITPEKTVDLFDVVYIPKEIALQTKNFWLNDGDLLMAMTGATIGKFGLIVNREEMSPAVLNQRVAKIAQKNTQTNKSWFIFVALIVTDVYDQVVNIGGGSAQPNISSSQIENCRFVVPSDAIILSFTNHVDPMMQKWLSNIQEARRLAAIRDALLPKLISGELRVPDAERIVGRCI